MAMGSVHFTGNGPFHLRAVQHAKACALDATIQLTLYATVDGQEPRLVQIETQMDLPAAEELKSTLMRALDKAAREMTDRSK